MSEEALVDAAELVARIKGVIDSQMKSSDTNDELFITDEGLCSGCGAVIDLDDLKALDFKAEDGGVSYVPGEPSEYWAEGTIACPGCSGRLWIQVC